MTLLDLLQRRIAAEGPMSVAEYMSTCLTHPTHGYYTNRNPFGAEGDFVTAPDISQMFGELIGLCLAQYWLDIGRPNPFGLVELGPGRGVLMADILRATKGVPGFGDALKLHMLEVSPVLKEAQAKAVAPIEPVWISSLDDVAPMPMFLVANEFLDALPIRQFVRTNDGWSERLIGTNADQELIFGQSQSAPIEGLEYLVDEVETGDVVETSAAQTALVSQIGDIIAKHGGLALIIDYGRMGAVGNSFQALKRHQYANPLDDPGGADLSAHVDFAALEQAVPEGARSAGVVCQGEFLMRLGISARADALAKSLGGKELAQHRAAERRLIDPDEMGTLFKVLAICKTGSLQPPGFDNAT